MMIFAKDILLGYKVWILDQVLQEIDLSSPVKAMKRTLNEISSLIQYIFFLKVYYGQSTIGK